MDRIERLRQPFSKTMTLIEIGASYNPIIPKAEGWNTTVIDHADRETLMAKYHDVPGSATTVEEVDYIWREGSLLDAVPERLHGIFDGLIASHVGEHMPDLIGFFLAAAKLLKPSGRIVLALPDKRLCFDFFHPSSTTGEVLDARGRTRHSVGTLYDHAAYFTERNGAGAWQVGGPVVPFKLAQNFDALRKIVMDGPSDDYVDSHTWYFTPASFQLLVLELNLLNVIPWMIDQLEPTGAIEFYAELKRGQVSESLTTLDAISEHRLQLIRETILETREQVAQLGEVDWGRSTPVEPFIETETETETETGLTISAIIPLYNGGAFIESALHSILMQTVPPKEIIVVDDGSTDNGAALVRAMAARHPQIKLLSKANGGQSSARNLGVAHSTGDLIALLDQDDLWYTTHLEQLALPFRNPEPGAPLGWVYSDLDEIDSDGLMICHCFLATLPTEHPKRSLFACLREDMFVLPSASLISRAAFDAVGGFDQRLSGYEDDDLFLRLFRAGYGNVFLKTALSKWRIYPESSSYSYRMRRSRAVYVRKLLASYTDDVRRARFIHRDLILPRFYVQAVVEYRDALVSGDQPRIVETREELMFLVQRIPGKRRIMGRMLTMMQSQRAARMAFASRHFLRPLLRRIV